MENEYYFDPAEGDVRQEITFGDLQNHIDPNASFDRLMHKENRPINISSENHNSKYEYSPKFSDLSYQSPNSHSHKPKTMRESKRDHKVYFIIYSFNFYCFLIHKEFKYHTNLYL